MDKVKINVLQAFRLLTEGDPVMLAHGLQGVRDFTPGVHEVEAPIAAHWFVKANCGPLPDSEPAGEPVQADDTVSRALDNFVAAVTAGEVAPEVVPELTPEPAAPEAADVVQTVVDAPEAESAPVEAEQTAEPSPEPEPAPAPSRTTTRARTTK